MNLSDIIPWTTNIIPKATTMSPILTTNQLPMGIIFPKNCNEAVSDDTKNNSLPFFNNSAISAPYICEHASGERGNLNLFIKNENKFRTKPINGININFVLKLAAKNNPAKSIEPIRNNEYKKESYSNKPKFITIMPE